MLEKADKPRLKGGGHECSSLFLSSLLLSSFSFSRINNFIFLIRHIMSALVASQYQPASSPYAFLTRRDDPVSAGTDFTARLSVWQRPPCQTNYQLAILIREFLQEVHTGVCRAGGAQTPTLTPWTVTSLPFNEGPAPQPIQVRRSPCPVEALSSAVTECNLQG
ncbi:uncharacterized protein LY89DRAFT_275543 [Mollisia scopiformis]|uniref:Uncharacterized protein n=1 Tax=Mollisia scopiformis TaxID=149040 RepID=A0A132BCF1_MOLSC|nr:uncharacterized protein LY89DRAFT_275543 [Mollisia scopiformis]KUJ09679.1 hypothetical protein LY89DRAFT_275543 [Mollisia scopiformis]